MIIIVVCCCVCCFGAAALDFPTTYETVLRKIHRLLFHVVAHLYHQHFRELLLLGNNGIHITLTLRSLINSWLRLHILECCNLT